MKAFIVLAVLVIVGVWLAYQFGGFKTMDPVAEAERMRIAVKPGMTWARWLTSGHRTGMCPSIPRRSPVRARRSNSAVWSWPTRFRTTAFPSGSSFNTTFSRPPRSRSASTEKVWSKRLKI